MAITHPIGIGLPWNAPLWGERYRSIFAPPSYRLQRLVPRPAPHATSIVSLDEVVLHLRLAPDAGQGPEAPLLEGMIAAATRHLEDYAGWTLPLTEWRMTLRRFPPVFNEPLDLPMPPFLELRRIVIADADQDIRDYAVEVDDQMPSRLYPRSGYWPWVFHPFRFETVRIDYRAGYERPEDVSPPLRQALLMAVAHWYENRESSQAFQLYPIIELGWEALLSPYRAPGFA